MDGSGSKLIQDIAAATGLPENSATSELQRIIESAGKNSENISLDEIRVLLADYLQDILLEAKESYAFSTATVTSQDKSVP
jgi:hypothetical protein